jgi:hypothetical protein
MKGVIFNDSRTVDLAIPVSSVEDTDSVPQYAVAVWLEIGRRANFKVGSCKDLLKGRETAAKKSGDFTMEEEKREEAFLCVRLDVKCMPTGI